MVEKIKQLSSAKKAVSGGVLLTLLGLIWTIYINPINADVKDLNNRVHSNKEKNIEQDGKIKLQEVILKRIDDNVKALLNKP